MTQEATSTGTLEWSEEHLPLEAIIRHERWQVRSKLDKSAVKRYMDMTKAGSVPPPIKVGRVKGKLYLIDGWHRMQAGALSISSGLTHDCEVLALVATMTAAEARWQAASSNLGHGVQYKGQELHGVFKAFVNAEKHVKPNGQLMSYREMAPFLGKPHTTIRTWMIKYFPKLAAAMGGTDHGNLEAEQPRLPDMKDEHHQAAIDALLGVTQRLDLVTPQHRWEIVRQLEHACRLASSLGIQEPEPDDF